MGDIPRLQRMGAAYAHQVLAILAFCSSHRCLIAIQLICTAGHSHAVYQKLTYALPGVSQKVRPHLHQLQQQPTVCDCRGAHGCTGFAATASYSATLPGMTGCRLPCMISKLPGIGLGGWWYNRQCRLGHRPSGLERRQSSKRQTSSLFMATSTDRSERPGSPSSSVEGQAKATLLLSVLQKFIGWYTLEGPPHDLVALQSGGLCTTDE